MCGLSGWVDPSFATRDVLEKMTAALKHRGPDAVGYYQSGIAALGHCRLAVIDLAASLQPMVSSDRRYALAYNGEIYNFRKLRHEMELLGHVFQTEGDTEVLLQALILWGEGALARLEGMFAFAFWDDKEKTLLLARDPLGIKPLYTAWDGQRLLFASEIKALLTHPSLSREIDPNALGLYLECQYIPAPFSIYRHIRKLPAAHLLSLKDGQLEQKRYWTPAYLPKFDFSEEEAVEQLEKELRRSVASMLVADVPLGAFISGGIDSSVIASLMQQESGKRVKLFHLGFDNSIHSEHEHAAKVASFLEAEYYPLIARPQDVVSTLDHLVEAFDEPFGDQAALPTLLLSQLSRRHVTVVLSGEGADEVFAGYSNYAKRLKEASLIAKWGGKYSPLPLIYPFLPGKLRKNRLLKAAARPLERRYTTIPNLFDRETHSTLLSAELHAIQGNGLECLAESHYSSCDSDEYLDRMLHIDTSLWLADDLLTKMDRASMFHSLEARVPYLDHRLVEFAARLPVCFKLKDGTGKYLLKCLAERKNLLPREIIFRSKQGFVLPLREWLAGDLKPIVDDALSSSGLLGRNIFRKGVIERLRKEEASHRRLHATRLWSLVVLELWFRKYAPDCYFSKY